MPTDQADEVYVTFFDQIDMERVQSLQVIFQQIINKHKPKSIYFMISSPGGDVKAGIVLYNYLNALPVKIITHNIGSIDSIALIIFLAGDERYAANHSSFLLHGIKSNFNATTSMNLSQIKEIESQVSQLENNISEIVNQETHITKLEMANLFAEGETKSLEFCLDKNIIHGLRAPKIPKGVIHYPVGPRNVNVKQP